MGVMIMNTVVEEKHKGKGQHDINCIFLPLNSSNEGDKTYTCKWDEIQRELGGSWVAAMQKFILLGRQEGRDVVWGWREVSEEVRPWTGNDESY